MSPKIRKGVKTALKRITPSPTSTASVQNVKPAYPQAYFLTFRLFQTLQKIYLAQYEYVKDESSRASTVTIVSDDVKLVPDCALKHQNDL